MYLKEIGKSSFCQLKRKGIGKKIEAGDERQKTGWLWANLKVGGFYCKKICGRCQI